MYAEQFLLLLIVVAIVAFFWAMVNAVTGARNMQELGIVLIIIGLFFGWPIMAIGAALVIAHNLNKPKSE
jgi:hypothetical protein